MGIAVLSLRFTYQLFDWFPHRTYYDCQPVHQYRVAFFSNCPPPLFRNNILLQSSTLAVNKKIIT